MTRHLKSNEVVRTVWRPGRRSTMRVVKQFDSMEEAFQTCRELNRPILAEVDGKVSKIFPSGHAKQLSDSGTVSPMVMGAFWIVPAVWLLTHFAVLQVVASFGR